MLKHLNNPIVLETHGGYGKLFDACYRDVVQGVVIEKDDQKISWLVQQRPTWSVYQADSVSAVSDGIGAHLPVNFVDCDPYGDPWSTISAFFQSERPRVEQLIIVVNDGLRQKLNISGGWSVKSLRDAVEIFGNDLQASYLQVCRWQMERIAAQADYTVSRFVGYYCGFNDQMTHYGAVLAGKGS